MRRVTTSHRGSKGGDSAALDGCDVLGIAQTGTGKTAAFSIPILEGFAERPNRSRARPVRALVLTPTRELALQVHESFETYGRHLPIRAVVILGGVGAKPQIDALRRGADILVATPGRLLDLQNQGHVDLSRVEVFVLDEADRMLDMGFIHDVRRVVDLIPEDRQTLFFSATMPPDVSRLANQLVIDPVQVEVTPAASVSTRIDQRVYFVSRQDKNALLAKLLDEPGADRVLVFSRTKHRANRVAKYLNRNGVEAEGHPLQQDAGSAPACSRRVCERGSAGSRGHRHHGAGHRREQVTHVINYDVPGRTGKLRSSDRTNGARGSRWSCVYVLRSRRRWKVGCDRAPDGAPIARRERSRLSFGRDLSGARRRVFSICVSPGVAESPARRSAVRSDRAEAVKRGIADRVAVRKGGAKGLVPTPVAPAIPSGKAEAQQCAATGLC